MFVALSCVGIREPGLEHRLRFSPRAPLHPASAVAMPRVRGVRRASLQKAAIRTAARQPGRTQKEVNEVWDAMSDAIIMELRGNDASMDGKVMRLGTLATVKVNECRDPENPPSGICRWLEFTATEGARQVLNVPHEPEVEAMDSDAAEPALAQAVGEVLIDNSDPHVDVITCVGFDPELLLSRC